MLVTDAMASVGTDDKSFELQGRSILVDDTACIDEFGTLAGSHTDMATAIRNAIGMLALELPEAIWMASRSPAKFLGLEQELGSIAPGLRANLVRANDALAVQDTWIDGRRAA
jgi:N-acetylglucosamine-6-phosphate deacetylase